MKRNAWIIGWCCVALGACGHPNDEGAVTAALGTETLGPTGLTLAEASGIVESGVGLVGDPAVTQPGTLSIDVPGTVKQVLIYWEAQNATTAADDQIVVDGTPVTGALLGGPTFFFGGAYSATYGADITALGLVSSGNNTLSIDGFESTRCVGSVCFPNGVGMLVLYDDGSGPKDIDVRDGNDLAFQNFAPPLDTTVPQTFTFEASTEARTATLNILATSVGHHRPNVIETTVGATVTRWIDPLGDNKGPELDAISIDVEVPAGETSVTVQLLSERDPSSALAPDALPASVTWLAAGFAIEPPPPELLGCRVTGGAVDEDEGNRYQSGGQAGAPTAIGPMPRGEWTHHQQRGPAGSFTFHAGTSSAPEGTYIDWIECSDPGFCNPARPAPAKQIDFGGLGAFRNVRSSAPGLADVVVGQPYWFEVNIDDLGEPGNRGPDGPDGCPADGFGRHGGPDDTLAMCGCADFYRIRIHGGMTDAAPVLYEVAGYIDGGNLQIHPPTGYDR